MEAQAKAERIRKLTGYILDAIAAGDLEHARELIALVEVKAREIEGIMRDVKGGKWRG